MYFSEIFLIGNGYEKINHFALIDFIRKKKKKKQTKQALIY